MSDNKRSNLNSPLIKICKTLCIFVFIRKLEFQRLTLRDDLNLCNRDAKLYNFIIKVILRARELHWGNATKFIKTCRLGYGFSSTHVSLEFRFWNNHWTGKNTSSKGSTGQTHFFFSTSCQRQYSTLNEILLKKWCFSQTNKTQLRRILKFDIAYEVTKLTN